MIIEEKFTKRIDELIKRGQQQFQDLSEIIAYCHNISNIIHLILGSSHPTVKDIDMMMSDYLKSPNPRTGIPLDKMKGALLAIKSDIEGGYFENIRSKIRSEVEADFLGQAFYLLEEDLKDAAAMIIGAVLEDSLRQLCHNNNVPEGNSIEKMNIPLKSAGVYGLPQQQQITAWASIRNKADHGRFSEYSLEEVRLMHQGVNGFIVKYLE